MNTPLQDSLDNTQKIHSVSESQLKLSKAILKKHKEGAQSFMVGDIVKLQGYPDKWEVISTLSGGFCKISVGACDLVALESRLTLLKSPSKMA